MIQGDPQRAACLSAQIDELNFYVGAREAFRRAIVLQSESNALRPTHSKARAAQRATGAEYGRADRS